MNFIPEIELQPLEAQQRYQLSKLKETLAYVNSCSPWYSKLFKETNTEIAKLATLADLKNLPTTCKQDLQKHNWDFLCVPKSQLKEYTATSGTMGSPVVIAMSEKDLERLAYNEYLSFHHLGASTEDVFQLMLTLDRQFMAGMAYYSGLRRIGASSVRTGPGLPAMQWDVIHQLQTTSLVGVPSFLLKMKAHADEQQIDLNTCTVKSVLAIGESLRDENLQPNALAKKIQEDWNIKLYSTYASTEMQTAFTECEYGQGGHHHPELVIVELLDEQGNEVPKGMPGEVTITTIGIEAMPLIRYRTGDMCKAYYEPCACGRKTMRLGPVLGRKQQLIKLKGTSLYPSVIFDLLNGAKMVEDYFVEVSTDEFEQDQVTIFINSNLPGNACSEVLKPMLQQKLRVIPTIIYKSLEEIQALQINGSRKPSKFADSRRASINTTSPTI